MGGRSAQGPTLGESELIAPEVEADVRGNGSSQEMK